MDAVLAREGVSSSQRVAARRLRMEALNEVIIRLPPVTSAEAHRHADEMSGYERRSLGLLTDARIPPFPRPPPRSTLRRADIARSR